MKKLQKPKLQDYEIQQLKETFDLFDTEGIGRIDPKELKAAMGSLGFDQKSPVVYQMIAELEQDNIDIGFDIFLEAIENKLGEKNTKDSINKIFDLFDEDRNNIITLNNLKKVANELAEDLSHDQLAEMLERASQNGKEITREDFYNIMIKRNL